MAYGAPDSLDEVEQYYTHIRHGRNPSPEQVDELKERYRKIGGRSPLLDITRAQAQALERKLNTSGTPARVYVGMKHWHPFIHESVEAIVGDCNESLIPLTLAPHYSWLSVGSYQDAVRSVLLDLKVDLNLKFVDGWGTHPLFIKAVSESIMQSKGKFSFMGESTAVIFSAHSLPKRILAEGDPYYTELLESARRVADYARIKNWRFAFQSASHTNEEWLGPDICEVIDELGEAAVKNILVCPFGFVADNLEILHDIDIECQQYAKQRAINLKRTASLNTSPTFIEALGSIVRSTSAS